ncbi:GNAT family N-acetyltransferase [Massilia sp. LXY-6]|uniref:GNAT family N-acetyltransferase n=1 Tax=Massilia sp. LXY-6 TaxID=3379823 RepID=UPI003EDFC234
MNTGPVRSCSSPVGTPDISFYENEVPPFARQQMEHLYQNTFSSTFAEHVGEAATNTYVVREGSAVRTIFLFQVKGRHVVVLNSAIPLETSEIEQFVASVFARYGSVQAIKFVSVETDISGFLFPYQQLRASEDFILSLPATVEAYWERLGTSSATTLRRKQRKLERESAGFSFTIHEHGANMDRVITDIIRLKTNGKDPAARLDEAQQAWLREVVGTHGFVGVICANGRVCAGAICTRVGRNYFMHVVAHDPDFDAYSPGVVCIYLTVCAAILRGGREFHFLWGPSVWKRRLRSVQHELNDIVVYRSRMDAVRCARTALLGWQRACWRRLKLGLLAAAAPERPSARIAKPLLDQWYRLKRNTPR